MHHTQAEFLASGYCTQCRMVGWLVGLTMAERVGRLFHGLLEGLSEEEKGHHPRPIPPSSVIGHGTKIIAKWRGSLKCLLLVYDHDRQAPPDLMNPLQRRRQMADPGMW